MVAALDERRRQRRQRISTNYVIIHAHLPGPPFPLTTTHFPWWAIRSVSSRWSDDLKQG
jgi:hypothetical protein